MAIPDFESIMRPLLVHLSDSKDHGTQETLDDLANRFGLAESERRQLLPSGTQELFRNRVAWAKFYLKKAGLVENPKRGVYRISQAGKAFLASAGNSISVASLQTIPQFRDFILNSRSKGGDLPDPSLAATLPQTTQRSGDGPKPLSPEESLEAAHSELTGQLAVELLERIRTASPEFFEHLVLDLLLTLGYGGSRRDAGRTLGRSGDGGVDGMIKEDRLGLDAIYIQAKRWEDPVGRPEVQKFAGALQGQRARKGIFITSSTFTREAAEFVSQIDSKIILIDGTQLTRLMIEHDVGVAKMAVYEVKRVDSDYFTED
jgi:restriction system protein